MSYCYEEDIGGELADIDNYERNLPYSLLEHHKSKTVKAKSNYECCGCGKQILIGERYVRLNVNYDGIYHFCIKCGS